MQPVGTRGHGAWFTSDDYPPSALQKNEFGYVGFSILIDPDGKSEKCDVIAPSAFRDLNDLSCSLAMRRVRFTPAIGSNGQPAYGLFRSWASWMVAADSVAMDRLMKLYPPPSNVDLTLFVRAAKLPDPIDLIITVDASGVIGECQAKNSSAPADITQLACEQLKSQWKPTTAATVAGEAVQTVQTARVDFRLDGAATKQP
ncbi:energy transducer TonB [Sphingomonas abietis]|uniref:Energy transducer TonB n=1 Tax=Sphingomonas abietis TaxID=3012344 RepID=A0ABY7NP52_9SPHN|nr:energy transducer TonB [Sphingomonas abietis]WBO21704.1 energy transducer TonB [Sphingomonas abietis]